MTWWLVIAVLAPLAFVGLLFIAAVYGGRA